MSSGSGRQEKSAGEKLYTPGAGRQGNEHQTQVNFFDNKLPSMLQGFSQEENFTVFPEPTFHDCYNRSTAEKNVLELQRQPKH
ncbi:hypothetical protein RRG08_054598 [Elysia crispata]|uniref:Uncharacterized protein n=1 Tax=Elysia crispata TaxID=231223 RepID=A0AAE1B0S8_9GAST|nr:hypothetical protein RRG08_054598 [Elysia crispata]